MLKIKEQALMREEPVTLRGLYDRHAGMLLGFIDEIVNDRKLAEDYLTRLFCDLAQHFDGSEWNGTNAWCKLQRMARGRLELSEERTMLSAFKSTVETTDHHKSFLSKLSDEQARIFCNVYYDGKTIAAISKELNKSEDITRKTLKEAFAIIRQGG